MDDKNSAKLDRKAPNIIILLADDLEQSEVSAYGDTLPVIIDGHIRYGKRKTGRTIYYMGVQG